MNLFDFFNFFSHAHSEIAENGADKVLSSEEENPSVQKTYVNFPTSRKSALDVPLYAISSGRSMVEMLGVLAIIGVLSVGAIAGYSKAMMKYKLNKQTEQIGSILDYATLHYDDFDRLNLAHTNVTLLFQKLGAIPVEMIKEQNSNYIYDVFNNQVSIYHNLEENNNSKPQYYGLQVSIGKNAYEICRNLYQMAKLRSSTLWITQFVKSSESSIDVDVSGNRIYGDDYCTDNADYCLKDLSLQQIHDLCLYCDDSSGSCRFIFYWNFKSEG